MMPVKLDHSHRLTIAKIFGHPMNHNIQWHDVCSLLARFGEVHETHRGNWAVTIDNTTVSFGSTRTRDLTEDQVVKVRGFLRSVGWTPDSLHAA